MILKIYIFILVLLILFFPQMPWVHSAEAQSESPCRTLDEHYHETEQEFDHDMNICIDIIQDIGRNMIEGIITLPDFELPLFFVFWENMMKISEPRDQVYFHKTDPPFFTSHHLVGIIKLTI